MRIVGGAFGAEGEHAAIGNQQLHFGDVVAEGAGGVVVLAVDVRADGAADGDLAGAREDRNPQAERQGRLHELIQGHAAIHHDEGGVRVDGVDLVERLHVDDQAAAVLSRVTVGAAHAAGDDAAAQVLRLVGVVISHLCDGGLDFFNVLGRQHMGGRGGRAAPAVQGLCRGV